MLIDHLLEGIFAVNGINKASEEEKILYLKSLRKSATRLWQSFQNQDDVFDYLSEEKQECYLLRYFYPYSTFLAKELSQLEESYFEQKNSYSVSFFGAGPAPELIGEELLIISDRNDHLTTGFRGDPLNFLNHNVDNLDIYKIKT